MYKITPGNYKYELPALKMHQTFKATTLRLCARDVKICHNTIQFLFGMSTMLFQLYVTNMSFIRNSFTFNVAHTSNSIYRDCTFIFNLIF